MLRVFSSISDSIDDLDHGNKEPLWKEQKQSWHKINPNLSDSAQLLFDSPTGYKLYISVSNAKSKRLCTHQQATEPAISLIVSRHGCLGSWPWYSWCHCFPLMNSDNNSKAILKSSNIAFTFQDMQFCWHRQYQRDWKHWGRQKGSSCWKSMFSSEKPHKCPIS